MTVTDVDVVVVGSGQAGAQAAISLRNGGLQGKILMVGNESTPPYNRPMLSKEYLLVTPPPADLFLRDENFWTTLGVDLLANTPAVALDPDRRRVQLSDGTEVRYGSAIMATGGSARELRVPGADLAGVRSLRTLADAAELRARLLAQVHNAVVVGGGYLGLESASALAQSGAAVTVVEALDALLKRATCTVVADHFRALHEESGVRVLVGSGVMELQGRDGVVSAVRLADGSTLAADLVLVATGMRPHDGLLRDAGAACDDGVLVDARCRTSLPGVYAVGDCARRVSEYGLPGAAVRMECVQNAVASAKLAAADVLGRPYTPPGAPRFWSNQFTTKFHSVGLFQGYDDLEVEGSPSSGSFAVVYRRGGGVVARDCVNTLAGFGQLKRDLEQRVLGDHRDSVAARSTTA